MGIGFNQNPPLQNGFGQENCNWSISITTMCSKLTLKGWLYIDTYWINLAQFPCSTKLTCFVLCSISPCALIRCRCWWDPITRYSLLNVLLCIYAYTVCWKTNMCWTIQQLIWSSLFRVTFHLERCNAEAVSGSLKVQKLLERDITVQRWIPKQHGFNWSNMIIISPLDCRPSENTNLQLRETGTKWIWMLLNKWV